MAYVYQVSFDIRPDQMSELEIGASLERVLGYLRVLLPSEPGFTSARALYSLEHRDKTHLIFQSVWDDWEDLEQHRRSSLAEDKVLTEFQPHVTLDDLSVHAYQEVD
jgi:quinol monooxygenase YgiN